MSLTLQPIRVATGEEGDGLLVFEEDWLVAVLVRLSELHGELAGWWFLEKGFDGIDVPEQPSFPDLDHARDWIRAHLADRPRWRHAG